MVLTWLFHGSVSHDAHKIFNVALKITCTDMIKNEHTCACEPECPCVLVIAPPLVPRRLAACMLDSMATLNYPGWG